MPENDNTAMGRYWNEIAGPRWVQRQAIQEARNLEMLDQLLAAARAAPGEQVLDIGCGTGVTSEPFAVAVGPQGHVTAVDISKPMLDAARHRIAARGLGNVTLLLADAQVHSFPPEAFDLVTSRLGVMFFADPAAAFRNLRAALRPGGRLCMAVWATVAESTHQSLPLKIAVRQLGPPAPQPVHAPGPNAYGDRDYLRGILGEAGFAEIAVEPRQFLVHGGDDAESAAEHAGQFGAVQRLMDEKGTDGAARQAIVEDIAAAFASYETAAGLRFPATFLLVTATKA
ncbi:MAG TPA: methyltransferase domain-containing protein [Stellaceae bacterium]|nr:methyltransferase domain-containing protein [Stellaceae bacterium]